MCAKKEPLNHRPSPWSFAFSGGRKRQSRWEGTWLNYKEPQKSNGRKHIKIITYTILGTDNFNIYFSQAINGVGPVLFRGQWGKDLTQLSWILYYVLQNSIFLPLHVTVNPLYFVIKDGPLNHYYYYMYTSNSLQNRSEIDSINPDITHASFMRNWNYYPSPQTSPIPPPIFPISRRI